MPSVDRRLAAIMFTDIVGYTRMSQSDERLALELLAEHRELVRPLLLSHGGTEIKTIGDAFLVEFKSALDGVLCAVEIQKQMSERNSSVPRERRLELRVGVHLGDVVHEGGDVYGDAVNVASRIEPLAESGGVCISQQVFDSIRNKTKLEFVRLGDTQLKNVELPVLVYRIKMSGTTSGSTGGSASKERLAVLPFVNISPDPNDEYFADGLTEELISKLSEIKGLKVIARTSVMNYKKKEKSVLQIGRELEAGSIIEGSVRKAGSKIRVTVQLIDSRTEEHLWATNYDKELDDIFAIQSDIASRVASSVSAGILPAASKGETKDIEAYTLYIKGMQYFHEGSEPSLRDAVDLLKKAIAKDPGYAKAHSALAIVWLRLATGGYENFDVAENQAEPLAKRALELDPDSGEAHAAMASVGNVLDKFELARAEAKSAVRINPNLSEAHLAIGIDLASSGRLEDALVSMERAYELDPLAVHVADILCRTARVAGKVGRSFEILDRMNELSPNNPRIISGLVESHMVTQDFDSAQKLLDEGLRISPREPLLRLNQALL
ncbi:MAG TPA: adenylate/guanylate cyclase domain-containing protein, partial [Nitrososphaerales archaeon]|nr:adenylate/guanylate cyclase domain-containing protein [Nitrososphaerales archaeon]